ncbi:MAG: tetratricopeptide repeat protein [Candidatus Eremiobacteraeota bacterium]|nr:tetratricopeptide repeat protein [Candidatus Eremiobacteraeota bacterium]
MFTSPARGLPPRIYLPIVIAISVVFLAVMSYLLRVGLGVTGTALGPSAATLPAETGAQIPANVGVGGGPPAPVRAELQDLRRRIARDPTDDVALVQLADFYLAANKFRDAIPFYRRALKTNPNNAAARAGLQEAQSASKQNDLP